MAKFTDPNRYSGRSVEEATYKSPGSAANAWSLVPVTCSEPTVVKEEKVFLERKVWSSLPYRRVTSRYKFNDLSGVMMDGERIVLVKVSQTLTAIALLEFNATSVESSRLPALDSAGERYSTYGYKQFPYFHLLIGRDLCKDYI